LKKKKKKGTLYQCINSPVLLFFLEYYRVCSTRRCSKAIPLGFHTKPQIKYDLIHTNIIRNLSNSIKSYSDASKFAGYLNCDVSDLDCLRSASTADVVAASDKTQGFPDIFNITLDIALTWTPTVDGIELGEQPIAALQSGNFNNMPFLIGTNTNEGLLLRKEEASRIMIITLSQESCLFTCYSILH